MSAQVESTGRVVALLHRRAMVDWLRRLRARLDGRSATVACALVAAAYALGSAGYVHAKAQLAQVLLRSAFDASLSTGEKVRPWPWADTFPVARLTVGTIDQVVLAGASGRTLAFGPALSTGGAAIGARGVAVISGHRDTHFAFLRHLAVGDRVWLETADGRFAYRIDRFAVVDATTSRIATDGDTAILALVTCFPFDAISPGGPLRYVATASLVAVERRGGAS